MKSIYILCVIVMLTGLGACKQDASTIQQEHAQAAPSEAGQTEAQQPANQSGGNAATGGHDYTFLTDKLFHYEDAYGGSKGGPQPFKDEWIDLLSDGTFKAGKLKEQTHAGVWSYNHDTNLLFLKPDDTNAFKMSEWKVLYNDQMMVWVGTQTYGNNPIQIKLAKSDVLP
jgi:hypothetical protein